MSDKVEEMRVEKIVRKYDGDFSNVIANADDKEMRLVLMYVARKANEKQRRVALDALAAV
jgi:hypothetical protein